MDLILYNPTRNGLNSQLDKLDKSKKFSLYRSYAKNFPEKWLYKFDMPCFNEQRLEYNGDEEELEDLTAEEFLDEAKCCGNNVLKPCLRGEKNDN